MSLRVPTYALARQIPYQLERGATQTIEGPVRYGASGDLVSVTEAGSTCQITRDDGTDLLSAAAITVSSSTQTVDVTVAATEGLGAGYTVIWSLIIGGEPYTFRRPAYVCEYVPRPSVTVADLFRRMPELRARVPQSQGPRSSSDVGWQPQIDDAWYEFLRWMLANAKEPWTIMEVTGHHDYVLARALQLCVQAIPSGLESNWARASKDLSFEVRAAKSAMRLRFDTDSSSVRRGASPAIRLAPTIRSWSGL